MAFVIPNLFCSMITDPIDYRVLFLSLYLIVDLDSTLLQRDLVHIMWKKFVVYNP